MTKAQLEQKINALEETVSALKKKLAAVEENFSNEIQRVYLENKNIAYELSTAHSKKTNSLEKTIDSRISAACQAGAFGH